MVHRIITELLPENVALDWRTLEDVEEGFCRRVKVLHVNAMEIWGGVDVRIGESVNWS